MLLIDALKQGSSTKAKHSASSCFKFENIGASSKLDDKAETLFSPKEESGSEWDKHILSC
jgi:hypothetical protein